MDLREMDVRQMNLRVIPRILFEQSLKVARLPLDTAVRLVEGSDPVGPVHIAIERTDATARQLFGRLTGDSTLVADAVKRRTAADKRQEALRRRTEAERDQAEAVESIESGRKRADSRRRQAEQTAESRKASAEKASEEQLRQVDATVTAWVDGVLYAEFTRAKQLVRDNRAFVEQTADMLEAKGRVTPEQLTEIMSNLNASETIDVAK